LWSTFCWFKLSSSSNCVLLSLGAMNSPPVIHPRFADWINTRSCWILNTCCRVYISRLVFWINEDIFQYISLNIVYWLRISNVKVPDIYPWKMLTVIMNIKKNHPFTVTPALICYRGALYRQWFVIEEFPLRQVWVYNGIVSWPKVKESTAFNVLQITVI
jgi:hypothetical protein